MSEQVIKPSTHGAGARFAMQFEPETQTLEMAMSGFWTMDDFEAYDSECKRHIRALRAARRWFAVLVDNTGFPVQSAEVSAALAASVERAGRGHRAPTALVVCGALSKLQAQRIGAAGDVKVFTAFADARLWIASQAPALAGKAVAQA